MYITQRVYVYMHVEKATAMHAGATNTLVCKTHSKCHCFHFTSIHTVWCTGLFCALATAVYIHIGLTLKLSMVTARESMTSASIVSSSRSMRSIFSLIYREEERQRRGLNLLGAHCWYTVFNIHLTRLTKL